VRLFHADLYGTRQEKYDTLAQQKLADVAWTEVMPTAPSYLFVPQNQDVREEYEAGWSVKDIFLVNSIGIATGQDKKTVAFTENEAEQLAAVLDIKIQAVAPVLYRPFDNRYLVYDGKVVTRTRTEVMRHMLAGKNIGLGITRSVEAGTHYEHVFVSNTLIDLHTVSMKEVSYFLPLYIYPTASEAAMGIEKHANLAPAFTQALAERIGHAATPEETFHYIYALLHSPTYRTRYSEFLKRDFPRLPLPPTARAFHDAAAVGEALVGAHLLQLPAVLSHAPSFPHTGTNGVDKRRADKRYKDGKIFLNDTQTFEPVAPDVWEYRIGGYQPAAKWLDDRAGRTLTDADITHYRRLLAAQKMTLALHLAADAAFAPCLEE